MPTLAAMRAWFADDLRRSDWVLGALALGFTVLGLIYPTTAADDEALDALGVVLALVPVAAIWWRRSHPAPALGVATVFGFAYWIADYPGSGAWAPLAILLYSAAQYIPNRRKATVVIVAFTALLIATLVAGLISSEEEELTVGDVVTNVVMFQLAWIVGDAMRQRREHIAQLERRTARAERDQAQAAALAVSAERNRIANELHDILAHSMSVVVVQAEGAKRLVGKDDAAVAAALDAIGATSRTTLADIRSAVGIGGDAGEGEQRAPAPDLSSLPALVDSCADAGLDVEVQVVGDARPLPAMIELSAYRIVQESLTNALKHGGPHARAHVTVDYHPDRLALAIRDTGRGAAATHVGNGGHGLTSMRERVESFGGTFRTGPRPGGGYLVEASLPVGER